MYDYLIVGSGFFGSVFAYCAVSAGKKCLVLDKRKHVGGNCYTENREGINVHMYGPHIFHTNSEKIWNFVNVHAEMRQFTYSPCARYNDSLYSLPFNMWTFNQLWGVTSPEEARKKIEETRVPCANPKNMEEYVLSVLGSDVYEKLIYGYTKKQWMRDPSELPASIIKRLPFRLTYDASYYNDKYCAMPVGGYTKIFTSLLGGIDVVNDIDYLMDKDYWNSKAHRIIYTGRIDEFFEYSLGDLEYRSLRFDHKTVSSENVQGIPVINYTSIDVPYTRIIEHKHFDLSKSNQTIITTETPTEWSRDKIPFYPVNDELNNTRYNSYNDLARAEPNVLFGGRLGTYKYYDMDQIIGSALSMASRELKKMKVQGREPPPSAFYHKEVSKNEKS
ncbi:MAG: UDP-galactopyranose mutase [Flammeovirgaceae bacterium]|nr:UDP-galactopyranose mutase [Flammeovirgaceae bacterium]|tara:strand:+ start:5353 stop:6519 length:1167 start_codon:yes stop_codon:yes gene_type:complete